MRVLLLADVHANWPALLALQRAEPRPDAVLFAGDAVGYGPDAVACGRWLLANATCAVRGNHEAALTGPLSGVPTELAEAAAETLALARRQLTAADQAALTAWPETAQVSLGGARFYLTHGTPNAPLDGSLDAATCPESQLHELFAAVAAEVIVLGHTHIPTLRQLDRQLIINPGSLGQPRYGVPDATYAVWDDGRVQIRHLHYDHDLAVSRLRLAPLGPETSDLLADVLLTGLVSA